MTDSGVRQDPNLSQKLWNDAYDELEKDEGKLVGTYVKILAGVLKDEKAADISVQLEDRAERQAYMLKLMKEGQVKVAMASKIMEGVGDVAQFILSVKGIVDAAVQTNPQAALPWAGVCVGLQVSAHSFNHLLSALADIH